MTYEQRFICSLEEIKAITFECKECKARAVLIPGTAMAPPAQCPNKHSWNWNVYLGFSSTESPYVAFLSALKELSRPTLKDAGFRVLLEFDEPKV
jgi:hypothetical protein